MSYVMAFTRHGEPWYERMDDLDECFDLMWLLEHADMWFYDRYGVLDFIFGSDSTGDTSDEFIFLSRDLAKRALEEYKAHVRSGVDTTFSSSTVSTMLNDTNN